MSVTAAVFERAIQDQSLKQLLRKKIITPLEASLHLFEHVLTIVT